MTGWIILGLAVAMALLWVGCPTPGPRPDATFGYTLPDGSRAECRYLPPATPTKPEPEKPPEKPEPAEEPKPADPVAP